MVVKVLERDRRTRWKRPQGSAQQRHPRRQAGHRAHGPGRRPTLQEGGQGWRHELLVLGGKDFLSVAWTIFVQKFKVQISHIYDLFVVVLVCLKCF